MHAELGVVRGRVNQETVEVDEEVRKLIMTRASAQDIKAAAIRGGMTTMVQDGLWKVESGLTSIEEVVRVVHE